MTALITKRPEEHGIALNNAAFCLDCEVISEKGSDECPACNSRSLVSLARMLGGSLGVRRNPGLRNSEGELFAITITITLQQILGKDVTTMVERLSNVIASPLAQEQATLQIKVKPLAELKESVRLPERDAA